MKHAIGTYRRTSMQVAPPLGIVRYITAFTHAPVSDASRHAAHSTARELQAGALPCRHHRLTLCAAARRRRAALGAPLCWSRAAAGGATRSVCEALERSRRRRFPAQASRSRRPRLRASRPRRARAKLTRRQAKAKTGGEAAAGGDGGGEEGDGADGPLLAEESFDIIGEDDLTGDMEDEDFEEYEEAEEGAEEEDEPEDYEPTFVTGGVAWGDSALAVAQKVLAEPPCAPRFSPH